jgi:hypothetical protein
MNGLTGNALAAIKIPIVLESDRQAMEVALHSVGHAADARMAIVRSTADLDELWVSEALRAEVVANRSLRILSNDSATPLSMLSTGAPLEFDAAGRLGVVSAARPVAHSSVQ